MAQKEFDSKANTLIDIDGKYGPNTKKLFQQFLVSKGYDIGIDGSFGTNSNKALQSFLVKEGYDIGKCGVDGKTGPQTIRALQLFLQKSNGTKIGVDGRIGAETVRQLQIFLVNAFSIKSSPHKPCASKPNHDEKEDEAQCEWTIAVKKTRCFTELTEEGNIKISVDKLANAIIGGIGAWASGGALTNKLAKQLKDTVVNISWLASIKNEKSVDHLFEDNAYLFLEMERTVKSKSKGIMIASTKRYEIEIKVKYSYVEAGNDIAVRRLNAIKNKHVMNAFEYIDSLVSWQ
eukprot:534779_1